MIFGIKKVGIFVLELLRSLHLYSSLTSRIPGGKFSLKAWKMPYTASAAASGESVDLKKS